MKAKFLTAVLILGGLFATARKSYGCNIPPVAILIADPEYVMVSDEVLLNGSASYDPDGSSGINGIVKFEWDRDGNGSYEWFETASYQDDGIFDGKTTYTYNTAGIYTVRLRVTDSLGATATDTCKVYVNIKISVPDDITTIQGAIDAAASSGATITVSEGTYTGDGNRDFDFLGKAITVRSTDPNDPAVVAATIISCGGRSNHYHRGFNFHTGETNSSILAGFTIEDGYNDYGGGIQCDGSSPTIRNCVIKGNKADNKGGGIYCTNSASPKITNCFFIGNNTSGSSTSGYGGGMSNSASSPVVRNCVFSENRTTQGGGAIYNDQSSPTLTNCTFNGNSAVSSSGSGGKGGGLFNAGTSSPTVKNCIFWDNSAGDSDPEIHNEPSSNPTVTHCCVKGGYPGNSSANPEFAGYGCAGPDGIYGTWDDGLALCYGSPCVDTGDNSAVDQDLTTDIIGKARIADGDHDEEGGIR